MKNVRCDIQGTPLDRLLRASRAALSIARRLDLVSPWLYRRCAWRFEIFIKPKLKR